MPGFLTGYHLVVFSILLFTACGLAFFTYDDPLRVVDDAKHGDAAVLIVMIVVCQVTHVCILGYLMRSCSWDADANFAGAEMEEDAKLERASPL